jgi:hypothetical protein
LAGKRLSCCCFRSKGLCSWVNFCDPFFFDAELSIVWSFVCSTLVARASTFEYLSNPL